MFSSRCERVYGCLRLRGGLLFTGFAFAESDLAATVSAFAKLSAAKVASFDTAAS